MKEIKYIILYEIFERYKQGKFTDVQFLNLITTILQEHKNER